MVIVLLFNPDHSMIHCTARRGSHPCPFCLIVPNVSPDLQSECFISCLLDLAPITVPLRVTQVSPRAFSIPVFLQQNFSQCRSLTRRSGCAQPGSCPALLMLYFLRRSPFSPVSAVVSYVAQCQRAYSGPVGCLKEQSKYPAGNPSKQCWLTCVSAVLRAAAPIRSRSALPSPARSSPARPLTRRHSTHSTHSTCCFRADRAAAHLWRSLTSPAAACTPKDSFFSAG